MRKGSLKRNKPPRLTFERLDRFLTNPPLEQRGPGVLQLPTVAIGDLEFDRAVRDASASASLLDCRSAFNSALRRAVARHHGEELIRYCTKYERDYRTKMIALAKPLRAALAIPAELVNNVNLRDVRLAYERELMQRLLLIVEGIEPPEPRQRGRRAVLFMTQLVAELTKTLPVHLDRAIPISRDSWFVKILAAGWRDASLPDVSDKNRTLEEWLGDFVVSKLR